MPETAPFHEQTSAQELSESAQKGTLRHHRLHLDPSARDKTWGEKRFDAKTYIGIGLIGNEVASFGIGTAIKEGNFAHGLYKKFEGLFSNLKRFTTAEGTPLLHRYIVGSEARAPRLPYLLVATIGGMLMVPFIKHREDHKGEIVRALDRQHYGAQADTDPELVEAHHAMDEAPKQSWGSLWKGRGITVLAAAAADFVFGWPDALSTKLFKDDSRFKKFSSLERIADTVGEEASKRLPLSASHQAVAKGAFSTATWLLTLSATLTALFYVSSKIFATKRDEKLERKQLPPLPSYADLPEVVGDTPTPIITEKTPSTRVHNATLAPGAQLALLNQGLGI